MNLIEALGITPTDVAAFVGGGGKTSAMFRVAAEVVQGGGSVTTTPTTRIFAAQTRLAPVHVQSLPDLLTACEQHPHVLWTGEVDPVQGKAFGVEPELIDTLKAKLPERVIAIEADGSRMRPFKAPADHEPVIPVCTTLVVPVVGIDAVGLPLTEKYIHRPERVAALWPGETVTPEMIAHVLVHPAGSRKNVPTGARCIALINKVETGAQMASAREIARLAQALGGLDNIVIGAINNPAIVLTLAW